MSRSWSILPLAMLMAVTVRAQGSGSIYVPDDIPKDESSPFIITRIAKGKIADFLKAAHGTFVLFEDTKGRRGVLKINSKTRFKADRSTEYGGKKHLSTDDLEIGQSVKITFTATTGQILELRFTAKS